MTATIRRMTPPDKKLEDRRVSLGGCQGNDISAPHLQWDCQVSKPDLHGSLEARWFYVRPEPLLQGELQPVRLDEGPIPAVSNEARPPFRGVILLSEQSVPDDIGDVEPISLGGPDVGSI